MELTTGFIQIALDTNNIFKLPNNINIVITLVSNFEFDSQFKKVGAALGLVAPRAY